MYLSSSERTGGDEGEDSWLPIGGLEGTSRSSLRDWVTRETGNEKIKVTS